MTFLRRILLGCIAVLLTLPTLAQTWPYFIPPSTGDSFTGPSGTTYTATAGQPTLINTLVDQIVARQRKWVQSNTQPNQALVPLSGGIPCGPPGSIQYNNGGVCGGVTTVPPANLPAFGAHAATLIVCASNTINTDGCDVTLTGASDQTLLNSAIASCGGTLSAVFNATISGTALTVNSVTSGTLSQYMDISATGITASTYYLASGSGTSWTLNSAPGNGTYNITGYNPGNGNGCKILLRNGTYNISGSIIIDRSHIDVEGESWPFWGAYNGSWTNTATPVGVTGTAGAKIIATASGFDAIDIAHANLPDVGETRHRGIRIANLYLVGNSFTSSGIGQLNATQDDSCLFESIMAMNFNAGIKLSLDNGYFNHLNLQGNATYGLYLNNAFATRVENSLFWDNGANDVLFFGTGAFVANSLGDSPSDLMDAISGPLQITGNFFGAGAAGSLYLQCTGCSAVGNSFSEVSGSYSTKTRSAPLIHFDSGSNSNLVAENIFVPHGTEPSGVYAVSLATSGGKNVVHNNYILQGFNNGSTTTIHMGSSTGDVSAQNNGDISAYTQFGFVGYTVATLPACSATTEGAEAYVTDATLPTYNSSLTGGGAVIVPVFCNGTSWSSH